MSGVILCTKKSDIPYRLIDSDINIYSIEELAYYLYNNAYFVDESFFTQELVDYIEKRLELSKVAQRLKYAMSQRMDFAELVMVVITSSKYYTESEIKSFEKELKSISSKSMLERMKARAKMLFDNGRISGARQVYENIIKSTAYGKQSDEFYADIHYGLAKIYCRMFYFKEAIAELTEAYRYNNTTEILKALIYAKIMNEKNTGEKEDFSEESERNFELVELCKKEVNDLEQSIINGVEYERLSKIFIYDGKHNLDDYYENVQMVLDGWKEEYRNDIA